MKRIEQVMLAAAAAVMIAGVGCHAKEQPAGPAQTATMAPAEPPPAPASESDTSLTQTTEIGEERSPSEGGVLTEKETADTTATQTTAPVAKKKHR